MTGQDLLDIAAPHVGESYSLGVLVPKNNAGWKGPWDCAEFASWVVYQASQKLYGCLNDAANPTFADAYTGTWYTDAVALGKVISVEDAAYTPGAVVLRKKTATKIGHIVFSDGSGGTIEAQSQNTGVVKAKLANRTWDCGILVPWIEYTMKPKFVPLTIQNIILLTLGKEGEAVFDVQRRLLALGIDPGPVNGVYTELTMVAVYNFQVMRGLVTDGDVGQETAAALGCTLPSH